MSIGEWLKTQRQLAQIEKTNNDEMMLHTGEAFPRWMFDQNITITSTTWPIAEMAARMDEAIRAQNEAMRTVIDADDVRRPVMPPLQATDFSAAERRVPAFQFNEQSAEMLRRYLQGMERASSFSGDTTAF